MIYKIIKILSIIIRQFYVDNPLLILADTFTSPLGDVTISLVLDGLNLMLGGIISAITFIIVGLFYRAKSCPPLGSILYLVFYMINNWIVKICCKFYPSKHIMIFIIVCYFIVLFIIRILLNKISEYFYFN